MDPLFGSMSYHTRLALSLPIALAAIFMNACAPDQTGGSNQVHPVNVIVAPVEEKAVSEEIELVGSLAPNERVELKSEISGVIGEIHFKEGDTIEQGELLFTLDDQKLRARFAEAEANFILAATNRERNKSLLESSTISEQAFDQSVGAYEASAANLELRKRELEDANISAPFAGTVGVRRVSPGQYIQAGQPLTILVNSQPIKADFQVPERFIGILDVGQEISISVAAYPKESFQGEVYFVSPEVDESTRNVLVRAYIENDENRLKPGMFGNLRLVLSIRERALVIPESAFIIQADRSYVMAVDSQNTAQVRDVTAGLRLDGAVEILAGLAVGEHVITEGHQKIGPGAPVNPLGPEAGTAF